VKTPCCGSFFELDPEVGRKFGKSLNTEIKYENLRKIHMDSPYKYCVHCKTNVSAEYSYCPYCGGKL